MIVWMALSICLSSMPCFCAPIDGTMRAEDKRLDITVTIVAPRIYIGELLERLSQKTGVKLSMDENDSASGLQISVFLKEVPLGDALNALWSLNSYQDATWHWERVGDPGTFEYHLIRSLSAKALADKLRRKVQHDFEKHAATLLSGAKMSAEERKKLMGKNKADDLMLADDRIMSGLRILDECEPDNMQLQILRGLESPEVPVKTLSQEAQNYIKSEWVSAGLGSEGPEKISIETRKLTNAIAPCLFIMMGKLGGYGYIGGTPLETQLQEDLDKMWLLPGDTDSNPEFMHKMVKKDGFPSVLTNSASLLGKNAPQSQVSDLLEQRLAQLSEAAPLSLIALLPQTQVDSGAPYDQTIEEYLSRMRKAPINLMHKWRQNILLLSPYSWYYNEDSLVPYRIIRQLHETQRKYGELPLGVLADLADSSTTAQLQGLSYTFPVLRSIVQAQNIFVLYHRFPEIRSERGHHIISNMLDILKTVHGIPLARLFQEASTICMYETKNLTNVPPYSEIHFKLLADDGKPIFDVSLPMIHSYPE